MTTAAAGQNINRTSPKAATRLPHAHSAQPSAPPQPLSPSKAEQIRRAGADITIPEYLRTEHAAHSTHHAKAPGDGPRAVGEWGQESGRTALRVRTRAQIP
jgi:hypothetical protein